MKPFFHVVCLSLLLATAIPIAPTLVAFERPAIVFVLADEPLVVLRKRRRNHYRGRLLLP